jgi:hypothetical protein
VSEVRLAGKSSPLKNIQLGVEFGQLTQIRRSAIQHLESKKSVTYMNPKHIIHVEIFNQIVRIFAAFLSHVDLAIKHRQW